MTDEFTDAARRIVVALDFDDVAAAEALVATLPTGGCRLKVGKELFLRGGPSMVGRWVDAGWDVFLDLKFHDIPNTVAGACRAAADLGVWMVNVHALGGSRMLAAAREAVEGASSRPLLIGVTVLTSHDEETLAEVGIAGPVDDAVHRLASLTAAAGLDGVVCSAREAATLRAAQGAGFRLVTPGIRPAGTAAGDQSRIMTPAAALQAGATDLVLGRPVTRAKDPARALEVIAEEIVDAG
ncbi:orotidine-5'-phosphate decarboxylase [Arhodomonas sp. AD133]|uniref:orotidine-5'-phosphate decarboxylase n=1 Tax=Arhodomonas sp. AD133 TaxID=3415009 RepID=UPI003EB7A1AD